ncbi:hypothetical protein QLQ12_28735 [Actinoplanes sp. NEAU-A12]|uniref:Uncharacterized protein n=1 Tax=Actinoplanes sandaracinus TaxID=3045177 RepID=A0ABT6WSB4_9ACTN|nr:hypothetical protein [Actinoplanes sandaracinus]MDI6102615.1 hypothetical protein [Actinoplanes sandaracinus]
MMPAPAFAGPPPTTVAAGQPDNAGPPDNAAPADRLKKLGKALVTAKDLPAGFKKQEDTYLVEMFRAMLGERRPGADPCVVPAKAKQTPGRPPAEPVKAGEPKAPAAKKPAGPPAAAALFFHEEKAVVAVETLAITGEETAVDMVNDLDLVLNKCPVVEAEGVKVTMRSLDWDPLLGDKSRTVGMIMMMNLDGVEMTMHGKLAQVAYRDVSMVVGLVGAAEPQDRHLKKIAGAAVRKLVASADLFATESTQEP